MAKTHQPKESDQIIQPKIHQQTPGRQYKTYTRPGSNLGAIFQRVQQSDRVKEQNAWQQKADEFVAQRRAERDAAHPPIQKQEAANPNNTGLPDQLKAGIENLSSYSMDDVKVHYNSAKPAQLQAHAYAQGTDIHLGPGQEKHLPHEAWHVVQQKQGRVKPTMQLKGTVPVNDDAGLEKEADVMGAKALQMKSTMSKSLELGVIRNDLVAQQKLWLPNSDSIYQAIQRRVSDPLAEVTSLSINSLNSQTILQRYPLERTIQFEGWGEYLLQKVSLGASKTFRYLIGAVDSIGLLKSIKLACNLLLLVKGYLPNWLLELSYFGLILNEMEAMATALYNYQHGPENQKKKELEKVHACGLKILTFTLAFHLSNVNLKNMQGFLYLVTLLASYSEKILKIVAKELPTLKKAHQGGMKALKVKTE